MPHTVIMRSVFALKLLTRNNRLASSFLPLISPFRNAHALTKHVLTMNEAFLRYETGSDAFDITFRYVDEAMHVDRQFNFSRQATESVNNFLKRIDTNVCKILNKRV